MPGLVPGIHVLPLRAARKTWMAGSSPAMTTNSYATRASDKSPRTVSRFDPNSAWALTKPPLPENAAMSCKSRRVASPLTAK